ncbi:MAG: UvrD-helicase domain-containing protein, partial [Chloroflexi bacterium]|nr:UvrD-helicase domain-containing protein [Chloroflexota bacterium]
MVTFTKKATQELVTRIRTTLRVAERVWSDSPPPESPDNADLLKLREDYPDSGRARAVIVAALSALDDLAVFTIHSFCQRMLEESALESRIPFKTTFVENDTEPFGRAANDWARSRLLLGATEANLVAEAGNPLASWVKELVQPYRRAPGARVEYDKSQEKQALLADFVLKVDEAFTAEKTRRHLLGFDDLLRKLWYVLEKEGADGPLARRIRTRFRAALIDEFQDTDRTQYPIFSKAFDGCPLFLIGDPKQSIYRFRGADIQAYLAAAANANRKFTLSKNWRSTTDYVQAVDALFRRADRPFLMDESLISFPEVRAAEKDRKIPEALTKTGGAALVWWWVDANLGTPSKTGQPAKYVSIAPAMRWLVRDIANEIVRLHGDGLPCKSVAVLVRTNKEARQVKCALDEAGIPSVIGGDEDVLESDEGKEFVLLASAVAAPHNAGAVRAAMSTRLWGSNAEGIVAIQRDDAERDWSAVVERLARAREQWRKVGIAAAFGELLAVQGAAERLLALSDGSRRLTNVRHILELLHEAWATDGLAPEGFQAWVARERSVPKPPERRQLRLETDAEAVQVLTIHKC